MAVANPKPTSIKQDRSHSLSDDQVSLDHIFDTKNCGKCGELVKEDAKAICCVFCFIWYHTKCAYISDDIYKFLRLEGDQIHWCCMKCNDQPINFMKIVHEFKEGNLF